MQSDVLLTLDRLFCEALIFIFIITGDTDRNNSVMEFNLPILADAHIFETNFMSTVKSMVT